MPACTVLKIKLLKNEKFSLNFFSYILNGIVTTMNKKPPEDNETFCRLMFLCC